MERCTVRKDAVYILYVSFPCVFRLVCSYSWTVFESPALRMGVSTVTF